MSSRKSQSPVETGTLMMKLLVLLTLSAVAIGRPPPCDNYCRTMWFSSQLPPLWDPLCDCSKRPSVTRNGRPVLTGTTIFNLDDTGVFFEPAKLHQVGGKAYVDQPFYIVNPINSLRRIPLSVAHNKAIKGDKNDKLKEKPIIKPVKDKRKGDSILDNLNTYGSYTFFYRKEDAPLVKARLNAKNHGSTEDLYKIKQTLSRCLDLHILAVSRNYNNDSELVKTWGPAKFHKFSKLSDDELRTALQQECNETEKFVKINVKEIIGKRPNKRVVSDNENSTQTKRSKPFLKPNFSNSYVRARASSKLNMKYKNDKDNAFLTTSIASTDATTLPSDSSVHVTGVRAHTSKETKIPPPTIPVVELFHITQINNIDERKLVKDKSDKVLNLVESNEDTVKSPLINSNKDLAADNMQMPDFFYNLTWYDRMKESNRASWAKKLKTASANKNNRKSITVAYGEYRSKYDENEIPPQKVKTREFANDTVESVINGTEEPQHDDSLIVTDETDFLIMSHVNEPNNPTETEDEMDDDLSFLFGNLYILLDEHYIPAKLIKKPNGKLSVAVDGRKLCTKPTEKSERMFVLEGICDNIKFNGCSKHKIKINN